MVYLPNRDGVKPPPGVHDALHAMSKEGHCGFPSNRICTPWPANSKVDSQCSTLQNSTY